jgi:ketosteroid isomerase-like protein
LRPTSPPRSRCGYRKRPRSCASCAGSEAARPPARGNTAGIASKAEIVERILDAWRDLESIPRELIDPEIEWINPPEAIEAGTRHGPQGFAEAQSAVGRAYSSIAIEVERRVERGDALGLIVEMVYHGRGSGIEVRQRMGMAFTLREGKLVRFEWSNRPEELLDRALGED